MIKDDRHESTGYLLDDVAKACGFIYLSDLHSNRNKVCVLKELLKVDDTAYPLKQWNETYAYIFRNEEIPETVAEIKKNIQKKIILMDE